MNKIQRRAAAIAAANQIRQLAKDENRELTDAEVAQIQAKLGEAATLKAEIDADALAASRRAELMSTLDAEVAEMNAVARPRTAGASTPAGAGRQVASTVAAQPIDREAERRAGFNSPREFFAAVMAVGRGGAEDRRLRALRVASDLQATAGSDEQSSTSDPHGGYLIPTAFQPNLLSIAAESDPTAGRTTRIPMGGPRVEIPARADKNHATSVTGGLRFYRRAETQTVDASRMEMEKIALNATSLMGKAFVTEELMQDSPISVAAILASGFGTELGAKLMDEKLRGTGVGQYRGILNAPCKVEVAKEAGQAADTIVLANVLKMRARVWGYSNAIWLANHDCYPQLATLALQVGVGGAPMYQQSIAEDRPDMLLGRPIFYTEFAETLGDAGDLICGNWSQYLEGELSGMEMAESIHVRFENAERCFRAMLRNDGAPWWNTAITPRKGASTLSPFVTLAARA